MKYFFFVKRVQKLGQCAIPDEIPFRAEGKPFTLVDYGCADGGTSRAIIRKCIGECFPGFSKQQRKNTLNLSNDINNTFVCVYLDLIIH